MEKEKKIIPHYENYLNEAKRYFRFTKNIFPQYIDELVGIATGARVNIGDYFFLNTPEVYDLEERYDENQSIGTDRCTIAVSLSGKKTIVGHNEDWSEEAIDELYLLKATTPKCTFFCLDYASVLTGTAAGMNEYGLIQCINQMYQKNQFGVPKVFIARAIMEAKSLEEAKDLIIKTQKASGYNHVLVQRNQGLNFEIAGNFVSIYTIKEPFVHTNHYVNAEMKQFEKFHTKSSEARFTRARELLKKNMTVKEMKELLSDRKNKKYPICRTKETIASLIFNPEEKEVLVSHGPPCDNQYIKYQTKE